MARYNPKQLTARWFNVSERTIENWHAAGYITGYSDGTSTLLYDLDEIERALASRPRTQMRDGRRRGPSGRVVPLPIVPEAKAAAS